MKKFLLLLIFVGCQVGPNYRAPQPALPETFVEAEGGLDDEDLKAWWKRFEDPLLDQLIDQAVGYNFDYQIALLQVLQARAVYWQQFAALLPEIDAAGQGTHFKASQAFKNATTNLSPYQNFFMFGFDAIWEIDVFGGLQRNAQAAFAAFQAMEENARSVKIVVIAEVVNTYAVIGFLKDKTSILSELASVDQELLNLVEEQFQAGLSDQQLVESARATYEQDYASLIAAKASLKQAIYSLSVLLGQYPETVLFASQGARPLLILPEVPVGLPSDLLRRRPDIREAERQLASQTELIGVAVADLFPKFSLTGSSSSFAANPLQGANIGWTSDRWSRMFSSPSQIFGIGLFGSMPLFDFGKRLSAVEAQTLVQSQAYLQYQKTVINALQEVEQDLVAYFHEEEKGGYLERKVQAEESLSQLNLDTYQAGLTDYLVHLTARQAYLAAKSTLTDSNQAKVSDLIALYKAMGGDW